MAQFFGDGEDGVGHRIDGAAKEALARGKAFHHVELVAVFTVNGDGNMCKAGGDDSFDRAPVAGVNDVWAAALHDPHERWNEELPAATGPARDMGRARKALDHRVFGIESACHAEDVLEEIGVEAGDDVHDGVFGATGIEAV